MLADPTKSPRLSLATVMLSTRQSPSCNGNPPVWPVLAGVFCFDSSGAASLADAAEFAAPVPGGVLEESSLPPEATTPTTSATAMASEMRPATTRHFVLFQGRWALASALAAASP